MNPVAVTWPYGMYDNVLSNTASELGLRYQFSLQSGPTELDKLPQINRIMLMQSNNINSLVVTEGKEIKGIMKRDDIIKEVAQ